MNYTQKWSNGYKPLIFRSYRFYSPARFNLYFLSFQGSPDNWYPHSLCSKLDVVVSAIVEDVSAVVVVESAIVAAVSAVVEDVSAVVLVASAIVEDITDMLLYLLSDILLYLL